MKEQAERIKRDKIDQVLGRVDFIKIHHSTREPIHKLVLDAERALENSYNQCLVLKNTDPIEYLEGGYYISFAYDEEQGVWLWLTYKLTQGWTDWNEKDGK